MQRQQTEWSEYLRSAEIHQGVKTLRKAKNEADLPKRYIILLAMQNIFIAIIAKILIVSRGSYGAPLILTITLWVFIIQQKSWSVMAFNILAFIEAMLGLFALVAFIGYMYHNNNPFPCVVQFVLSLSYISTALIMHKLVKGWKGRQTRRHAGGEL